MERKKILPPLFRCQDGSEVESVADWEEKRRPEIVELFREYVYGREPKEKPELQFHVLSIDMMLEGKALRKKIHIRYKGPKGEGDIYPTLFLPKEATKPVPVFLFINHKKEEFAHPDLTHNSDYWPVEEIIERGYGTIVYHAQEIDPDFHDEFQNGVHPIFDPPKRPANAWGTIAAWAWGASRVMDYLEQDEDVNREEVFVIGHSRGGKTALWAGTLDERFSMVISNNSGCTGVAITRGKKGENVKIINTAFPHWFSENYKQFNDREEELPIDQHMLLAAIAPRYLYVTSASLDEWADPDSEFLATVLAGEVYQLYGYEGLGLAEFPAVNTPIFGDRIAYHVREGEHRLTGYDWARFMDFWDKVKS